MKLPPKVQEKYLNRLDELIRKGEQLPVHKKPVRSGRSYVTGKVSIREVKEIDYLKFIEWRTNCITILEQVAPKLAFIDPHWILSRILPIIQVSLLLVFRFFDLLGRISIEDFCKIWPQK